MKKIILWILGISLLSLGIGLAIIFHNGSHELEERTVDVSKTASLENIDSIIVASSSANIIVSPTQEKDLSIHYFGQMQSNAKENPEVKINKVGSDLKIESGMASRFFWYSPAYFDDFKLEVKVPSSYAGKIEGNSNTGDIEVDSLNLQKLTISTKSAGGVNIVNCQGEQEINTIAGDVKITDNSLLANKIITTNSGDVSLFMPADSSFSFIYNTNSGELTNLLPSVLQQNDEEHVVGTVGDGKYNVSIKASSGNLNINKN